MQGHRLEAAVDVTVPRLSRLRRRLVFAVGFLAGAAIVAAIAIVDVGRAPPPAVMATPEPVLVPLPGPVIVTTEPAAMPADPLGCPAAIAEDGPVIGRAIARADLPAPDDNPDGQAAMRVVAAGTAPVIALHLANGTVRVSDDDGAHFRTPLADIVVDQITLADDGTLYAIAGSQLAVRRPGGKVRWHEVAAAACPGDHDCRNQIAVLGDTVVWFHDSTTLASANRGRTWRTVEDDSLWQEHEEDADRFVWDGAVYAIRHYEDMCGVSDTPVNRFDGTRSSWDVFHDYYVSDEPVLAASDDVGTSWTWTERCWPSTDDTSGDDLPRPSHRCKRAAIERRESLIAATLRPRTGGGRVLAAYRGSLIELCAGGAREVYRDFPYPRIGATDWRGRPLIASGDVLLRWSAAAGWRRLFAAPLPLPDDGD